MKSIEKIVELKKGEYVDGYSIQGLIDFIEKKLQKHSVNNFGEVLVNTKIRIKMDVYDKTNR